MPLITDGPSSLQADTCLLLSATEGGCKALWGGVGLPGSLMAVFSQADYVQSKPKTSNPFHHSTAIPRHCRSSKRCIGSCTRTQLSSSHTPHPKPCPSPKAGATYALPLENEAHWRLYENSAFLKSHPTPQTLPIAQSRCYLCATS